MRVNDLIVLVFALFVFLFICSSLGSAIDKEFELQDKVVQSYKSQ